MITTFDIRFGAITDTFAADHNPMRYKEQLKILKKDIGKTIDAEKDFELLYLYRRISQELSFIVSSDTVRRAINVLSDNHT